MAEMGLTPKNHRAVAHSLIFSRPMAIPASRKRNEDMIDTLADHEETRADSLHGESWGHAFQLSAENAHNLAMMGCNNGKISVLTDLNASLTRHLPSGSTVGAQFS